MRRCADGLRDASSRQGGHSGGRIGALCWAQLSLGAKELAKNACCVATVLSAYLIEAPVEGDSRGRAWASGEMRHRLGLRLCD